MLVFGNRYLDRMSTKSTEFLHIWHRMPVHKTHDFSTISYFRKVSKLSCNSWWRLPQGYLQVNLVRVPPERVHSVLNHPWGDKPANNKETYGLSTLGAGSDLSRTFFLISCTTYFTRLLTTFRRYIQRLVSMSIADGLASTYLLLLYILAIYLHIYIYMYIYIYIYTVFPKHSIYLNPTKTVGDLVYIPRQNICNHHVYGSTNSWPIPFEREQFWSRINANHRLTRELSKYRRKSA